MCSAYVHMCICVRYYSGWLIKYCSICKNDLESKDNETFHKFIKIKEYNNKSWLCYPRREFSDVFSQIENITYEILKASSHKNNLLQYIKTIVCVHIHYNFLTCTTHKDRLQEYITEKKKLFCINNWRKEINNILLGKSQLVDINNPINKQAHIQNKKYEARQKIEI